MLDGVADFLYVFCGGALLGSLLGLGVAEMAGRLGRLPSTALTIAVAYGSFAMGEEIFGFSGVMASVSAGLVLAAFSHTLIPKEEVRTWHAVWESIGFVANGILFLLIGIVIDADLIFDNLDAIAIGVAAVMISRPLAIFSMMPLGDAAGAAARYRAPECSWSSSGEASVAGWRWRWRWPFPTPCPSRSASSR